MRVEGREESQNVEDRRSQRSAGMALGGGGGAILLVILALLFGADPRQVMKQLANNPGAQAPAGRGEPQVRDPEEEEAFKLVKVVLKDTEDVWKELFRKGGKVYQEPKMVVFSGSVQSACGSADASIGPFYCPGDQTIYIDLTFFKDLRARFKAPGDFAQAYVIAHEVGHHVQNLLGISGKVHAQQQRMSKKDANQLSVRLELQADFFAGVFAHHAQKTKNILESGDLEEALNAAQAIGDDRLQKMSTGTVMPDSFTHGSSKQRYKWFRRGVETGDLSKGDTFNADDL